MKAAGILLAAGRGSRMKDLTKDRPKCLVELAGQTLLHWQLKALDKAGIERLLVLRGHAAECIQGDFETAENSRWADTNMVSSLLCADGFARDFFSRGGERIVVSYSDIVYHPDHVHKLLTCDTGIALTFDTAWEPLWRLRFGDPLLDAETFRQENGLLQEIGSPPQSLAEIQGQYMGLLSFNYSGWQTITEYGMALGDELDTTDMTSLLHILLEKSIPIGSVPVAGKWCEIDSSTDLLRYETALQQGSWLHDWR